MHGFRIDEPGGPDVLKWQKLDLPDPKPGEIQVKHLTCGVNYIDVYHRSGLYPLPMPTGIGLEACGTIVSVGDGVTNRKIGDRVAYGTGPLGAYSDAANVGADRVIGVPDSISDDVAAAMMLKGMTAQYLLRQTYEVQSGDTILVHAAAGGVGLILCQWANHLGATVIGTVGSSKKADLAKAHGCHHTILYRDEDVAQKVRDITDGNGVPVVYDSVGQDTLDGSIDSLRQRGLLVSFGNASGPVPPIDVGTLSQKGSLYLTRPTLFHYTMTAEDLARTASDVVDVISKGVVKIDIHQRYSLRDAPQAHRDLEARKTTGATVLIP